MKPRTFFVLESVIAGSLIVGLAAPLIAADDVKKKDLSRPVWTMDLSKMNIPDVPASGKIHGQDFTPEKAELNSGRLTLRQGADFFPDLAVDIFLFLKEGETVDGRTFRVASKDGFGSPHIHMKWKPSGDKTGPPQSEIFMNKYAMVLQFGKIREGAVRAKVYLCLPDKSKSFIAGTFIIGGRGEASKATEGSISGRFTVRDSAKNLEFTLDCLGKNQEGKLESPGGGFKIGGPTNSVTSTTWAPRTSTISWDKKAGIGQHQHVNRPAGNYLVSLRGNRRKDRDDGIRNEGYYDFKWVELKDTDTKVTVDLVIDRSKLGSLEVSLPNGSNQWIVVYLPLDSDGKLPLPEAVSYMQASSSMEVQGDKAVIRDLREGKYLIASATNTSKYPANNPDRTKITAQSVVEVRRGTTTKATLAPSAIGVTKEGRESRAEGRADLAVERVYLENGFLRATVKNRGTAAAVKFKVTFFIDGQLASIYGPAVLQPGKELAASAAKLPPGTHSVKVTVDADDVVPDLNETNNSKDETLSAPQ